MKTRFPGLILGLILCLPLSLLLVGCGETKADPKAERTARLKTIRKRIDMVLF